MQFKKDDEGLDYWVIDGQVHGKLVKSTSANLATIGKSAEWRKGAHLRKARCEL